jgi:hypothetical protein
LTLTPGGLYRLAWHDRRRVQNEVGAVPRQGDLRLSGTFHRPLPAVESPNAAAADPGGTESFSFQKRVVKDAELFAFREDGSAAETEEEAKRGFADVWKKGFFGWEYKGKRRSLEEA